MLGPDDYPEISAILGLSTVAFFNLLSILSSIEIWLERPLATDIPPLGAITLAGAVFAFHYCYLVSAGRLGRITMRYGSVNGWDARFGAIIACIYMLGSVIAFFVIGTIRRESFGVGL